MSDNVLFSIRIPRELHRKLRFIAADKNSSLNNVIVSLLSEAAVQNRIISAKLLEKL